ncbi:MAG: sensor histidine kinase, partial [Ignavibacteria bacterium]|nr:sensor histidine kinase [Ignavibacteria bacterium]
IRLDVSKNQKEIQFSIKDEGIGISKNDLKKLFEPFFRGENAVSIPGIGLGLTIVKKFTGLINAKVKCLSKINEGSEFILLIPDEK